ncbi:hypothetical protein DHW03_09005 [Pedobacter yonginense]|uniref:Putative auto-transporter adhesin head GIN domain-containing protein n=1 Tax=Pedobacter yonginense TaxID=651869 RepID=A0A317EP28_9SPHI|nr:DUF2807 domain-containing protein [Pedobacter yonginense]PWS27709.1 hypothetical protein DHW03_09005 [Pedobacter yonginense]
MKNSIQHLCAVALTIVALSTANLVAKAKEINANYTALTKVKNINKITISGNVKVILVQDGKESVEVYNQYFAKNALVQQQGTELRISSFEKETLTVIAHVNNLSSIEASNNSTITTAGKFNLLSLNIVLKDQASATINANTVSLYSKVGDDARLKLEGTTENHLAVLGTLANLKMDDFMAQNTNISALPKQDLTSKSATRYDDLKTDLLVQLF